MMVGFGAASLATSFVNDFGQLIACRCIVGIFEAGFLTTQVPMQPLKSQLMNYSAVYYLSLWYTRKEIALRIGIFYSALVASSAFGGLISYGVFQMKNTGKRQWFYLFIIEGSLTMIFGLITLIVIPKDIRSCHFLTDAEKKVAEDRILLDSVQSLSNKFSWSEALSEFRTVHPYIRIIIGITYSTLLNSNTNFLAIIVGRLGYNTVKTNLVSACNSLL